MTKLPKAEPDTMERLFKEHHAILCLVSFGVLNDRDAAKDIVQDFFVSYWQKKETLVLTVSFKAYAIGAVKNLSLLSLKRNARESKLLHTINLPYKVEPNVLDEEGKGKKLQSLLNKLPERRRHIFMSFVVHGQSYSEIAESNGISINTVKTQMKRAYAFLRAEGTNNLMYYLIIAFSLFT